MVSRPTLVGSGTYVSKILPEELLRVGPTGDPLLGRTLLTSRYMQGKPRWTNDKVHSMTLYMYHFYAEADDSI